MSFNHRQRSQRDHIQLDSRNSDIEARSDYTDHTIDRYSDFKNGTIDTYDQDSHEIVLKLPGRFFGPTKIQNEVAVLLLLEQHCPSVPAPRIIAWSDDGTRISAIQNGKFTILYDTTTHGSIVPMKNGWIMVSKLPGRSLTRDELHASDADLIGDLAGYVKTWRTEMPGSKNIGNLLLRPSDGSHLYGLETVVNGTLHSTKPKQPMGTPTEFYNHLLTDQINKLHTNESFLALRETIPRLENFRRLVLPKLVADVEKASKRGCFGRDEAGELRSDGQDGDDRCAAEGQQESLSVFTHQDIAPRNILVVDDLDTASGLRISGILDFEFAGFFPAEEEFLTCMARQADDWDEGAFGVFLEMLEKMGVEMPCGGVRTKEFEILCDMVRLIEYCAPWHLESGCIKGDELLKQLVVTRTRVEVLLDKLERLAPTD